MVRLTDARTNKMRPWGEASGMMGPHITVLYGEI